MLEKFKNFYNRFDEEVVEVSKGDMKFSAKELKKRQPAFYALINSVYEKIFLENKEDELLYFYSFLLLKFFEEETEVKLKKMGFSELLDIVKSVEEKSVAVFETRDVSLIFDFLKAELESDMDEFVFEGRNLMIDTIISILRALEVLFLNEKN